MSRSTQILWALFKTLLFTIFVPGVVGVWVPYRIQESFREAPDSFDPASSIRWFLAAFLFCSGAIVYLWCAWDFSAKGLGTPAPIDAPKKLIVNGLYRYVRNPMYLGVAGLIAGQGLLFRTAAIFYYFLFFLTAATLFVIFYEEPHLRRVFADQYNDYCRQVPRWIPRFPGYRRSAT